MRQLRLCSLIWRRIRGGFVCMHQIESPPTRNGPKAIQVHQSHVCCLQNPRDYRRGKAAVSFVSTFPTDKGAAWLPPSPCRALTGPNLPSIAGVISVHLQRSPRRLQSMRLPCNSSWNGQPPTTPASHSQYVPLLKAIECRRSLPNARPDLTTLLCVPDHKGIPDNKLADTEPKAAAATTCGPPTHPRVPSS